LIKRILESILKALRRKKEEEVVYTREQFIEAVKELSGDPVWRAKILRDSLNIIKANSNFTYKWIDRDEITEQMIHRGFSCGITLSQGDGIYAMRRRDWMNLITVLQQDYIKYVPEFTDCDNFATFFKGFADYIAGRPIVIYTTGLVLKPETMKVNYKEYKTCICKSDYLVGGHGWNRIVTLDHIEFEKTGSTEKIKQPFTLYNYEPQNDMLGDRFMGKYCYQSGGALPIIYGKKLRR